MHKIAVAAGGMLIAASAWPMSVAAQAPYPSQPVKLVIGNIAGASTDTVSRIYSGELSKALGQQVIVVNQPGAGGTIAAEAVARSAPDGYTIKVTTPQAHAISPHLYKRTVKYDPMNDFVPITMLARTENVLVVSAAQPFKTVKDIIEFAKANPGKLNMANAGPGSQSHLAAALFTHMAGITVLHVPYKGAASVIAVVGNQNELTLTPMPATAAHIASGKLRAVAVGGSKRAAALPNVPTIDESGVKGYETSGWLGFVGPKGTPPNVVKVLRDAVIKVAADPAVQKALERAGAEAWTTTPEEMWKVAKDDLARYELAVKIAGAKVD